MDHGLLACAAHLSGPIFPIFRFFPLFALLALPLHAIELDGRLDEPEWAGAQRVGELMTISPLTRETPPFATEVRVHSDERGLFFGLRVQQPKGEPRTRHRTARDAQARADRINLMLDLDGGGVTGYEFTVSISGGVQDAIISNQRSFAYDWDGLWHWAVHEDDGFWSVEVYLPWTVAPMGPIVDGKRRIGACWRDAASATAFLPTTSNTPASSPTWPRSPWPPGSDRHWMCCPLPALISIV